MSNKNYDDINIPADLDLAIENGALKAKNEIRKKRNKKYSIIAASIVGFITLGIISQPVLAEQIPALGKIYEAMGFSSVEKSLYIGQSITVDGIKITLENIACSRNKALIAYRIQADKSLIDKYKGDFPITITPLPNNLSGIVGGGIRNQISDNEILYFDRLTSQTDFESDGDLQINIFSEELGINRRVDIKVNFEELVSNTFDYELKPDNWNEGEPVHILRTSVIGSSVITDNIGTGRSHVKLLKINNRIYPNSGAATFGNNKTVLEYNTLYPVDLNGAKSITVLDDNRFFMNVKEVNIDEDGLTDEEIISKVKEQCEINRKEKDSIEKSYINGISYPKELIFENGNKAEILKCEKRDGKIYFDVKGTRDSEAWALANAIYVTDINNKYNTQLRPNYFEIIDGGYRVEFDDILEGDVKVVIDPFTEKYYDRKITEELKLNIKN